MKEQLPLSVQRLSGKSVELFGRSEAFLFYLAYQLSLLDHRHELNTVLSQVFVGRCLGGSAPGLEAEAAAREEHGAATVRPWVVPPASGPWRRLGRRARPPRVACPAATAVPPPRGFLQ